MKRMLTFAVVLAAAGFAGASTDAAEPSGDAPNRPKIPVILDTDIGDDIDDTWALALLLKSPEVDIKLVVSDRGNTEYRAKIIAKLLEVAGRTDIPVGVGIQENDKQDGRQAAWVADYDLARYPGKVHRDGVAALIDTIMKAPQPITLICIGPVPNIRAALERQPEIAKRARFVGMHGSVRLGYDGGPEPSKEWNVVADAKAAQSRVYRRMADADHAAGYVRHRAAARRQVSPGGRVLRPGDQSSDRELPYLGQSRRQTARRLERPVRHGRDLLVVLDAARERRAAPDPRHGRRLHTRRPEGQADRLRDVVERPGRV